MTSAVAHSRHIRSAVGVKDRDIALVRGKSVFLVEAGL